MEEYKNNRLGLDIGCGERKLPNFLGLDFRVIFSVDIGADAHMLPLRDEIFDHVYSSHTIEHFSHTEIQSVIVEWIRVLKKGGTMEIRCPDLRARSLIFFFKPSWSNIVNIYGEQDHSGNYHKCGFSYKLLRNLLDSCGIKKIKRVINGYKGIPFIPDCLHVKGIKQ